MKRGVFLVILLIIPIVYAQGYSQNEYVIVDLNLNATVDMQSKTNDARLESFEAKLSFFPKNYENQEVVFLNVISKPTANTKTGNKIDYKWSLNGNKFEYGFESRVKVKNSIFNINKKVEFPITGLREEDLKYTQATEYIDISPLIIEKANEVVEGEEDLFKAVVKLAEWTRLNIDYSLNTLTESSVQKSSWVLATKEGVCDEITNLFVSFLRSLNIPTKYVSGMSYSNVIDGWGAHAWSEVYFPNYGWVPFDVTFGQYGWIDPSHIKMSEGLDAKEPSVMYSWRALNVEIEDKEFILDTNLVEKGGNINELVELEINVLKDNLGGGSYVPVEVKVKNLQSFYLSTQLFFVIAPEIIKGNEKSILLSPKQERKIYWILKTDEVKANEKYMALLEVRDSFGSKAKNSFNFDNKGTYLSLKDAEKIVNDLEEKEIKKFKHNLFLDCNLDKNAYYLNEEVKIICNIENTGNTVLDFDLCFDKCEKINLKISEKTNRNYSLIAIEGKNLIINAKNDDLDLKNELKLEVFNEPFVDFNLKYDNLRYDEQGKYKLNLNIKPKVYDLKIELSGSKGIKIDEFYGRQDINIPFKAWRIWNEEIKLKIKYKDNKDKKYIKEEKYKIEIEEIPLKDKFWIYFQDLLNFV